MSKKISYEIGADYSAWEKLVHEMFVDEEGNPKEPTEEEKKYLEKCFLEIVGDAETKFDNMGRLIKNIEFEKSIIEGEKVALYKEVERLRKRIEARENKIGGIKSVAAYLLGELKLKSTKTPLFSYYWLNSKKSARQNADFKAREIPVEFLKPEISPSAINKAIEEGRLYEKENDKNDKLKLNTGKLFYRDDGVEKVLQGVSYLGGSTLVVR